MARQYLLASTIVLGFCVSFGVLHTRADSANQEGNTPSAVEVAMWEYALGTRQTAEIDRFLDLYPNSTFSEEASLIRATLSDEHSGTATYSGNSADRVAEVKFVTFDQPLDTDALFGEDRSIKRLIDGSPEFPPIADLPEEYWEGKNCGECHNWEKTTLCDQAHFFYTRSPDVTRRIKHPYGGVFKDALRRWAAGGCR